MKTITVTLRSERHRFSYPATVAAPDEAELSFRVSGNLVDLPVVEGATVKKGDVIGRLDTRDFNAEIARLNSQLAQAQAQLSGMTAGARGEDVAGQQAVIAGIRSQIESAEDRLADATLRAPFNGIIASRAVENFTNIQA